MVNDQMLQRTLKSKTHICSMYACVHTLRMQRKYCKYMVVEHRTAPHIYRFDFPGKESFKFQQNIFFCISSVLKGLNDRTQQGWFESNQIERIEAGIFSLGLLGFSELHVVVDIEKFESSSL